MTSTWHSCFSGLKVLWVEYLLKVPWVEYLLKVLWADYLNRTSAEYLKVLSAEETGAIISIRQCFR
jgi:hypothetical protein